MRSAAGCVNTPKPCDPPLTLVKLTADRYTERSQHKKKKKNKRNKKDAGTSLELEVNSNGSCFTRNNVSVVHVVLSQWY